MKKTIIIFVLSIFIGLFFIGSNVMTSKSISNNKKEVAVQDVENIEGYLRADYMFFNADYNYNGLTGFRYKLTTWNGKYPAYSEEMSQAPEGAYIIRNERELTGSEALDLLSEEQRNAATSIHTFGDLYDRWHINNYEYDGYYCRYYDGIVDCMLPLPTYFVLEQVRVPAGYNKQKIVLVGTVELYYSYQTNNNYSNDQMVTDTDRNQELKLEYIAYYLYPENLGYFEYDNYEATILKSDSIDEFSDWYFENFEYDSTNWCSAYTTATEGSSFDKMTSDGRFINEMVGVRDGEIPQIPCPLIIKNKMGSPELSIQAFVNNKESISTTTNSKIPYRINVKNSGKVASYDNVITATLPDGFTIVNGSISNGGTYNSDTNTITWRIYTIDENSNINLTFEAYAPGDLSSLKSYVCDASIEASNLTNRVTSNKTIVRLMANPKTNAPLYGIGITLIIVWGIVFYLYFDKRKKEVIKAS